MKVKEESEKVGLKLNIQKTKIMASGPITSWEIDGETVEAMVDFILGFPGGSEVKASAYNVGDPGRSLGREDLLEKEMANHSSIFAWKIPWMEEPGRLQSMGSQWGNSGNSVKFYFGGAQKSLQMVIAAMKLKDAYFLEGKL